MDNFKCIYRILKSLDDGMDFEEFDPERISPEVIGLSRERWEQLLIQLQKSGYVEGLNIRQYIRQTPHILLPVCPFPYLFRHVRLADKHMPDRELRYHSQFHPL